MSADPLMLGHQNMSFQAVESLAQQFTLTRKGHRLFHGGAEAEELAYLVKSTTKTSSRRES
uniref:hypothetical protein n=1 Tax=Reticulibacter mediterranei TaxID=2778369 RepID=UPI001C68D369